MLQYYRGSIIFTILAIAAGYALGGITGAWVVMVLGMLETSLSFDNAVVNASILQNWSTKWQNRFITYGMPIAVFGMRFAFPVAIVAIATHLGPWGAINLAIHQPLLYAAAMQSVHLQIAAFGGAFLMMIALNYFLDASKDVHWLEFIEAPLTRFGGVEVIAVLATVWASSLYVPEDIRLSYVMAGIWGLVTYLAVGVLGDLVSGDEDGGEAATRIIKEGVVGLLYLELIDASCSFDGVIGAFALSTNIFMIMLGLGVGAMFVRSMTLQLVAKGTLSEYRYLEHGAFYSIAALSATMFIGVVHEVPDVVVGFIGVALLGLAMLSSVRANKQEAVVDDLVAQIKDAAESVTINK